MFGQTDAQRLDHLLPVGMDSGAVHHDHGTAVVIPGFGIDTEEITGAVVQPDGLAIQDCVDNLVSPAFLLGEIGGLCRGEKDKNQREQNSVQFFHNVFPN